ncbi:hypothetical protein [Actinomadura macra]|uniref:hypothetical protein n=1 Tax=Actinomadura macra TaxID=46164 RepID=UPI0008307D88|nr:hypothetical protein [Actinomadura macra]
MTTLDAASRVAAQGETTLVMYGKGAGETARRMLPKLPDACFIPADLEELPGAVEHGLTQVVLIAGMDEQAAIAGCVAGVAGAAGVFDSITLDMDGGRALAAEIAADPTALRAYELWEAAGRLGPCGRELCRRTAGELERRAAAAAGWAASPIAAQVVLVDATGQRMVGMFGRMAR